MTSQPAINRQQSESNLPRRILFASRNTPPSIRMLTVVSPSAHAKTLDVAAVRWASYTPFLATQVNVNDRWQFDLSE